MNQTTYPTQVFSENNMKPTRKLFIEALIITLITISIVSAVTFITVNLPSHVNIETVNLNVYSDSACINPLTQIDWGTLTLEESKTVTIYLLNTGVADETLNLTSNAPPYLFVTWDMEGQILQSNTPLTVHLTLTVSDVAPEGNFDFTIILTGEIMN